jgi:hypothetical protein
LREIVFSTGIFMLDREGFTAEESNFGETGGVAE